MKFIKNHYFCKWFFACENRLEAAKVQKKMNGV